MSQPPSTDTNAAGAVDPATLDLKIPPCPEVLASFSAEAQKDDPDMRVLATLIGKDAGLAAAILKAVNSPLFGLTRKAADIPQALAILGLRACTNLITGLLLRQAFPVGAGPLMARYWDESMRTAEAAIAVATRVRGVSRDQAHTYTLFRNCGMAVMITRFPDYASMFEAHANTPGPELALTEEARYRFDHARVGYALARGWQLPEALCRTILLHHEVAQVASGTRAAAAADPTLLAVGLLAEQVVRLRAGQAVTGEWSAHEGFALQTLGIEPDAIVDLVTAPAP